jgi:type VI secretion system secreted protein Hcp
MAETDYLLELDGIEGESKDMQHPDAIHLDSFSIGGQTSHLLADGKTKKVAMGDLQCTKHADKSSPLLLRALVKGEKISKAKLIVRKAGSPQQEYLVVELEDVFVSSYTVGHGADTPVENFALSYGKITYSYREQQETGGLKGIIQAVFDLRKGL